MSRPGSGPRNRSNGPLQNANAGQNVPVFDFASLSEEQLLRYLRRHNITVPGMSPRSSMASATSAPSSTQSDSDVFDLDLRAEVEAAAARHFAQNSVQEKDVLASFIYNVRNKDNMYKLPP